VSDKTFATVYSATSLFLLKKHAKLIIIINSNFYE